MTFRSPTFRRTQKNKLEIVTAAEGISNALLELECALDESESGDDEKEEWDESWEEDPDPHKESGE